LAAQRGRPTPRETATLLELDLTFTPAARFDVFDATAQAKAVCDGVLERHQKALYTSLHTTAGYLPQALVARLKTGQKGLDGFFGAFRALFPPGAEYRHDLIHLREDLTDEQRRQEPRNGDSHLTFIAAGMRNCVTHRTGGGAHAWFVDLDGVYEGNVRTRTTTVTAYDVEDVVERFTLAVPVSHHPIDAVNLGDPRLGLIEQIDARVAASGIEKGRVDLALHASEKSVGLTVNEYETLLMQHDLAEVLRNPFKFAAQKSRHILDDPLAVPGKTVNYATYDFPRVLNSLIEAFHMDHSLVERLLAKALAVPARRFLRVKRVVTFAASDRERAGRARTVRGRYQSPILVQWGEAASRARQVEVTLVRFR
jgi:thiamine phosphate synthase YjbQ (UPF0047 family)